MIKQFYTLLAVVLVQSSLLAQAPVISYATPQSYVLGVTIPPLTPINTGGLVTYGATTTLAGSGDVGEADGSGVAASFDRPYGVAVDAAGNIYVADTYNHKIRKINPAGVVSTLAGSGVAGATNGTGVAASFNLPSGVAVDATGTLYVADVSNNKIRKITPDGVVTTLAGSGSSGAVNGTGVGASFNLPHGVAVDASGNIYVADSGNHKIRKITPAGVVTTLAGSGSLGFADGSSTTARFYSPYGVAVDASGTVYVADNGNNRIRKIASDGKVSTLAGSGQQDDVDAKGNLASFYYPKGVAVDASGTVYVADGDNYKIRQISPAGEVSTLAGSGVRGAVDGNGTAASFYNPYGIAIDGSGTVYVADTNINKIRKINAGGYTAVPALPVGLSINIKTGIISGMPSVATPATVYKVSALNASGTGTFDITIETKIEVPIFSYTTPQNYEINTVIPTLVPVNSGGPVPFGTMTTLSGSGVTGSTDGSGTSASFSDPLGAAMDASGNIYVADYNNNKIRKITPEGVTTTFAGSGAAGFADGSGTTATFRSPIGVAVDASGNVYVADSANHKIRKITPAGVVSTLAGSGTAGFANGTGAAARFYFPSGVAVDASGNVYVADTNNQMIRKITSTGVVSIWAGSGVVGAGDYTGVSATFNYPRGIAVDASGNVYVGDVDNNKVRKINPAGRVITLAGSTTSGDVDATGVAARFYRPSELAVDASGTVYVADRDNSKIKKISPTGVVTTLADGTNGAAEASFNSPSGVGVDPSGNVYVVSSNKISKLNASYTVTPKLPEGLYFDASTGIISGIPRVVTPATVYTVTATNSTGTGTFDITIGTIIKKPIISYTTPQSYVVGAAITPIIPVNTGGQITGGNTTTLAGSGAGGTADGSAVAASFNLPRGVAVDASGNLYVTDVGNNKIRKITPAGVVSTLAGSGTFGYANGTGVAASFKHPGGIAVDASGIVYVADTENNVIRKITAAGVVSTFAGSGTAGSADGTGVGASFNTPFGIAVDASGTVYVADTYNNKIRKITPAGEVSTFAGNGSYGAVDGSGIAASFYNPPGVAVDASGNVYVADGGNYKIRKITPGGLVSTLAGNGTQAVVDGNGTEANFYNPHGIAVDASGTVYVSDSNKNKIRKITPEGVVSTWAGSGTAGDADGNGSAASFSQPKGVAVDALGNIYVGDSDSYKIRKINAAYTVVPSLPAGLSIDASTGTISGTPSTVTPATVYTVTATNASGTGTFDITIGSRPSLGLPTIIAPADQIINANYKCSAENAALGTPVTCDNCSVAVTNDAPVTFPLGDTIVTWTVKDANNNTATATQIVTVKDATLPTITAPTAVTVNTNANCTATGVVLGTPTTADNCTVTSITNNAPSTYPLGNTTVTWTVKDSSNNTATSTQIVTVKDVTLPSITAPAAVTVNTNANCTATGVVLGTPVTTDNCTISSVTNNAPSVFPLGNTTVTWTVKDASNNTATATQTVTVKDVTLPTITAPADKTVNITTSNCTATGVLLGTPTTTDNCTITSVTNNAPSTYPLGNTTVTWTVKDASNNSATATQIITVKETVLPTITAPPTVIVNADLSGTATGVTLGIPTTTDNCSVSSVTNNAPTTFPLGNTTVTWTVKDASNNTATATQIVTVKDTAPTTLIPDINFEKKLISLGIDSGVADGKVLTSKIASLTSLTISNSLISDLTGIQDFVALKELYCVSNPLTTLDISKNIALTNLNCTANHLTALDVSKNIALTNLECGLNQLTTIDVSKNIALTNLNFNTNQLTTIDLSKNTALTNLNCDLNQLTSLDISKNVTLTGLQCSSNKLTNLDVTRNTALIYLYCDSNKLSNLDVSKNVVLTGLQCFSNQLTSLDISKNVTLNNLYCNSNQLISFNLKNGKNTLLGKINFTNNPNLSCIQVDNTAYSNTNWTNAKDITASYSEDCREPLALPSNNFTIESKGESCLNQNNGEINITAKANYNYIASINGTKYPLVNNSLKVSNLAPAIYNVSITITGELFEQNFTVTIPKGATITAKSTVSSRLAAVEITEGTAPYTVFVNGEEQFETASDTFSVGVNKGDFLEIKTAKACEGIYLKEIDTDVLESVLAHPNPTSGKFEIEIPISIKKVAIDLYTMDSKIISKETYTPINGRVPINIENQASGVYIAKIYLSQPKYLKIIKK